MRGRFSVYCACIELVQKCVYGCVHTTNTWGFVYAWGSFFLAGGTAWLAGGEPASSCAAAEDSHSAASPGGKIKGTF